MSLAEARVLRSMLEGQVNEGAEHGFFLHVGRDRKSGGGVAPAMPWCYLFTLKDADADHTKLPAAFLRRFGLAYLESTGTLTHELGMSLLADKITPGSCGGGRVLLHVDGTVTEESF